MPVAVTVVADMSDLTNFAISPPGGGWTVGWTYTVTLGTDVVDQFGVKLAEAASASFTVSQMPTDAGRPPSDAGTPADTAAPADAGADAAPGG
jgi:hypothetical protein